MASREEQEYSSQAPAGYIGDLLSQTIFPYATQYFRDQFANLGREDSSPFTYTGQRVADFDPRERLAFQLSDSAIGSYRPYLGRQAGLLNEASQVLGQGRGMGSRTTGEAISQIRGAVPDFRGARTGIASSVSELGDAVPDYSGALRGLGRAELSGFGSTAGFDPRGIGGFYNPFEEAVVQQTLEDINRGFSQADIGLRDRAISQGAFGGSRGRIAQEELARQTGRGAGEAIGAIRSGGFQDAANRAQQAFENQMRRQAGFAGLQSQLAGQRGAFAGQGAQAALGRAGQLGRLAGQEGALASQEAQTALARGNQLGRLGQQQFGMGFQGSQGLASLGNQFGQMAQNLPALQQADINRTLQFGGLGRGRSQSLMDLDYANFTGQYNLPMQLIQNLGGLTASLGPLAGGFGYAGATPSVNQSYTPNQFANLTGSPIGTNTLPFQQGLGSFSNQFGTPFGSSFSPQQLGIGALYG
jgi:hypothetical protein